MGAKDRDEAETKSGDRFQWALEILRVRPDDHVLEIGCGTGRLAGLIAQYLVSGRITAIDRSGSMIARAKTMVPSEKIRFLAGESGKVNLPANHYSKAIAFNVSGFWTKGASEQLDALRPHLRQGGAFYLFHQPPTSAKTAPIAELSKFYLEAAGFRVKRILFEDMQPAMASCIISSPAAPESRGRK